MTQSRCPICSCEQFYVKDPDDEFETYEFKCREGQVCFDDGVDADGCPDINDQTEIFCSVCSWRGQLEKIK